MVQHEIKPNMRQIVTTWMLEVSFDILPAQYHPALMPPISVSSNLCPPSSCVSSPTYITFCPWAVFSPDKSDPDLCFCEGLTINSLGFWVSDILTSGLKKCHLSSTESDVTSPIVQCLELSSLNIYLANHLVVILSVLKSRPAFVPQ